MTDEGYEQLFRAEHAAIVRSAFLVTGDRETAREVAQEAFAELHVPWRKVRTYDRPGAWVRRVAIRKGPGFAGGACASPSSRSRPRPGSERAAPVVTRPASLGPGSRCWPRSSS